LIHWIITSPPGYQDYGDVDATMNAFSQWLSDACRVDIGEVFFGCEWLDFEANSGDFEIFEGLTLHFCYQAVEFGDHLLCGSRHIEIEMLHGHNFRCI